MFYLYWLSADGQSDIPMGEYDTRQAAEAAMDGAMRELIDQCGDDDSRDAIKLGHFEIVEA